MTANYTIAKVEKKVEAIIGTGADPDILDGGYEKHEGIQLLKDYADRYPDDEDLIHQRATHAIKQLSGETSEEDKP